MAVEGADVLHPSPPVIRVVAYDRDRFDRAVMVLRLAGYRRTDDPVTDEDECCVVVKDDDGDESAY